MNADKDPNSVQTTHSDGFGAAVIGGAILILAVIGLRKLFADKPEPQSRYTQRFWADLDIDAEEVFPK